MFNQFALTILERLHGQKMPVLLHEFSGTTERTWRNRFKHGWDPTDEERKHFQDRANAALTEKLVNVCKWPIDEARRILAERPSAKTGMSSPIADLIYNFSPRHGEYCGEAIALAIYFDRECDSLAEAIRSEDIDNVRVVLITMFDWLRTFCSVDSEDAGDRALQSELETCTDIKTLLHTAAPLIEALLFHVLSCWDIEFCAGYFKGMQATPLFQLVMPRLAPDIEVEPETGRFLRVGRQPRKRIFEPAISRLLDFLSVMASWQRHHRFPDRMPRVKDFAAWSSQDESRIVSWRDETTKFTARQLEQLWREAIEPDSEGIYPAIPFPMFVCAHLWSPLLVRDDQKNTGFIDCATSYYNSWERNRDRLIAKGLQFGEQAWPGYLTAGRSDNGALASFFAPQSAGRPAQPRDCQ